MPKCMKKWTTWQLYESEAKRSEACFNIQRLKVRFPNTLINNPLHPLSSRSQWQWGHKIMMKAKSSIIRVHTEGLLCREPPYLKYRTETLIIDEAYIRDKVCAAGSGSQEGIPSAEGFPLFSEFYKHPSRVRARRVRSWSGSFRGSFPCRCDAARRHLYSSSPPWSEREASRLNEPAHGGPEWCWTASNLVTAVTNQQMETFLEAEEKLKIRSQLKSLKSQTNVPKIKNQ